MLTGLMSYCCFHNLAQRPSLLVPPVSSRVRFSKKNVLSWSLSRSSYRVELDCRSLKKKQRICCFRHEESSSGIPDRESVEDKLIEEVEPEFEHSSVAHKAFISNLKEVYAEDEGEDCSLTVVVRVAPPKWLPMYLVLTRIKPSNFHFIYKVAETVLRIPGKPWIVPWTAETILQVMLLWIASFWLVGSWIIPFLAYATGFHKESLTFRGQALYSLLTDVSEGLAGIAILRRCLSRFRPLPPDWFHLSLKGNWKLDVGLGCLMFPLVNRLSQVNLNLVPSLPIGISSVEQSIAARDPVAMALYAMVVAICAPIWEEIVFRGFLLPSLTKYMPVWCSILVSSVVFALAHFNAQRMLPLIFLGMVMGVVFTRSRNLLASIVLHSLWNGFVFLDLMK